MVANRREQRDSGMCAARGERLRTMRVLLWRWDRRGEGEGRGGERSGSRGGRGRVEERERGGETYLSGEGGLEEVGEFPVDSKIGERRVSVTGI